MNGSNGRGYTQIPNVFFDECELSPSVQVLFLRLLRSYGYRGCAYNGPVSDLSDSVRIPKRTLERDLHILAEAGYIQLNTITDSISLIILKDELWDRNNTMPIHRIAPDEHIPKALRARVLELRSMPYAEYLCTPEWQVTRRKALQRSGGKCQVCGKSHRLEVHHNSYARIGYERATDLVVLCEEHHTLYHQTEKGRKDHGTTVFA